LLLKEKHTKLYAISRGERRKEELERVVCGDLIRVIYSWSRSKKEKRHILGTGIYY